ncbi:complex I subunit 5 family protein [Streptomyces sp. FXJ1.172]|uniref:complex I subunit 5 family protein n=1 Tax=Streptomyces sp. FXJ1.172 TaxID=710705 RepID=UPI0007CF6ADE|nr:complex I subunit 5 family protein [Streptomyces sp. FXJ1.172]WEO99517.1 complex I subunit 5 family protein [Streptomyces sp. FXJ1.172]
MVHTSDLLPLAVAVPLLGAVVLVVGGRWLPRPAIDALVTAWAVLEVALLGLLWLRTGDGHSVSWLGGWSPVHGESVGIVMVGDRIGIGLALLTSALVLAVVAYSWRYFEEPPVAHAGTFPALILLFEAGMCGFALTGDLFDAFVFFELMGAVAYALTGYRIEDPRPVQGALIFGVVNSLGAYCSLLGIGLVYARTGELGFAQIGVRLAAHRPDTLTAVAFVLVVTGLLVKAAVVPLHFWLPDAHSVAPTPVCMLLSGVMVELAVYGTARVYWVVFSGPHSIAQPHLRAVFVAAGVLTALVGAVMCWQQRHLKRLLAFSTVGHVGLFLIGTALLTPAGTAGTALYVVAHAGVKAALFAVTGVLLDRHGSVDEHGLYRRGRDLPFAGALFALGGFALAGLPPFGTALGKAVTESAGEERFPWLPVVFVGVSAVTGAAVLRAGARIFAGAGPRPRERYAGPETTGDGEEPEIRDPQRRVPVPMLAVPAVLLGASLAVGLLPGLGVSLAQAARQFTDRTAYTAAVYGHPVAPSSPVPDVGWSAEGVLLALASTALAALLAAAAVWGPALRSPLAGRAAAACETVGRRVVVPLRRLHSGHLGDYVTWLAVGVAVLLVAMTV